MNVYKIVCSKGEVHGMAVENSGAYLGHKFLPEEVGLSDEGILALAAEHAPDTVEFVLMGLAPDELLAAIDDNLGETCHFEHIGVA